MKKLLSFATLSVVLLFAVSCSKTDVEDPAVVLTSVTASKTDLFTDQIATITLEGTGYTDAYLTCSNTKVKITKVASTVFEISATEATTALIYAELKNKTKNQTKTITLTFAEHGVKNFNTVEGIKVNTDGSAKVVRLLGEPELKSTSTDGLAEYWRYFSKGLYIIINKSNSVVEEIDLYSSNYYYTNPTTSAITRYTDYGYEIGNGWKINNIATTMDMVVTKLGPNYTKSTQTAGSTNRTYVYAAEKIVFNFYGATEDDYSNKPIIRFIIY